MYGIGKEGPKVGRTCGPYWTPLWHKNHPNFRCHCFSSPPFWSIEYICTACWDSGSQVPALISVCLPDSLCAHTTSHTAPAICSACCSAYYAHHTPYTIYYIPYTPYNIPHTIYSIPYTPYHILHTIYHILHTIQLCRSMWHIASYSTSYCEHFFYQLHHIYAQRSVSMKYKGTILDESLNQKYSKIKAKPPPPCSKRWFTTAMQGSDYKWWTSRTKGPPNSISFLRSSDLKSKMNRWKMGVLWIMIIIWKCKMKYSTWKYVEMLMDK